MFGKNHWALIYLSYKSLIPPTYYLLSIWRDKVILHQCVCKRIWQSSHWLFFFIGILWALQTRLVRTWRRESCDGSLVMTVKIERIHDFQQWSLSKTVLKRLSLTEEKELLWSWDRMIWTLGGWNNRIIWPQNQDRSLQNYIPIRLWRVLIVLTFKILKRSVNSAN